MKKFFKLLVQKSFATVGTKISTSEAQALFESVKKYGGSKTVTWAKENVEVRVHAHPSTGINVYIENGKQGWNNLSFTAAANLLQKIA